MQRYWVTADTHFRHQNIIKYSNRPYSNVEIMNKALILNWNEVVEDDDTIFHLGDVGLFPTPQVAKEFVSQLKGYKILLLGNHDRKKWDWKEIGFDEVYRGSITFCNYLLSHKPLEPKDNPNELTNVHGHIHEKSSPYEWQVNVSVEQTNYTPALLCIGGNYGEEKESN